MKGIKRVTGIILLAVFTVFTGFVVIECAMADLTGQVSSEIIGIYDFAERVSMLFTN